MLLAVLTLALAGCGKTPTANPTAPGCLQYALGAVTLSGQATTERITAPGKDYREALLLNLDQPICIAAKSGEEARYPAHEGLIQIELVPRSDFADAFSLAGKRVSAHGSLVPLSGDGAAAPVGLVLRTLKADE
ncbi:hypothetical protein EBB59_05310 [Lysobacter pythonis]|uniref:DUF4431 domain-containing protein n=2 Tax=Solilutibacter pythonis TaxID=2483112 RepID=A0A3M2HW94_9GAMM|nr:hypothetical protein EBB59_05310 [Lysobacter pythonis]